MLHSTLETEPVATNWTFRQQNFQCGLTEDGQKFRPPGWCKDCLVFTLGSEQKLPCRSARRPRVRRLFPFVISSRFSPLLSPSLSTRPPAQDNRERITFHPTLTASRFPPFISFLFLFPCTLGNDNRFSAAAARHSYAPEHSSIDFSSFSLTFSLFSLLQFPECSAQRLRVYLPIHDADPLTNGYNYQSVWTHVFKLPRQGR